MGNRAGKITASLLLASMTVAFAVSCADKANETLTADTSGAEAETTAAETEIKPDLPANLNFNGEKINIWYFTKNSDVSESFINIEGALDGDVVNEALYTRNLNVEETLGVDLVFTDTGIASSDVGTAIRKIIMSGSKTTMIYITSCSGTAPNSSQRGFITILSTSLMSILKSRGGRPIT